LVLSSESIPFAFRAQVLLFKDVLKTPDQEIELHKTILIISCCLILKWHALADAIRVCCHDRDEKEKEWYEHEYGLPA